MKNKLVILLAAIMGLASCSNTSIIEDTTVPIVFANNRVVGTPLKGIEQASSWSNDDAFGVYATKSSLSTFTFMDHNTKVSLSDLGGWTYEDKVFWSVETEQFTFFAYFPYISEDGLGKPTLIDDNDGRFNIDYQVKEEVELQEDLLWDWIIDASELLPSGDTIAESSSGTTSFAFQHALSKVKFRIKTNNLQSIYITSLSLTAYGNGVFSTIRTDGSKNPTTPTWEIKDPLMTFSIIDQFVPSADNSFGYLVDTKLRDIGFILTHSNGNNANYEAIMIPQPKTEIKIRLSYDIIDNNIIGSPLVGEVVKEFTDIDFQYDWLLGHQYVYDINIASEEATLTTSVGNWDDFGEIYSFN